VVLTTAAARLLVVRRIILMPAAFILSGQVTLYRITPPGVETLDDLEAFFDEEEFAVVAVWSRDGVIMRDGIVGNFDRPAVLVSIGEGAGSSTRRAGFLCPAYHVQGIRQDDQLAVNGGVYLVRDWKPDGTGLTKLELQAA